MGEKQFGRPTTEDWGDGEKSRGGGGSAGGAGVCFVIFYDEKGKQFCIY